MVLTSYRFNRYKGIIVPRQYGGGGGNGYGTSYDVIIPGQSGNGLGGFLRKFGTRFTHLLKKMGGELVKAAAPEIVGAIGDIASGQSIKATAKRRGPNFVKSAKNVGKANLSNLIATATQSGRGRGRVTKRRRKIFFSTEKG